MSNLVRRVLRYMIAVVLAAALGSGSIVSVPQANAQNIMAPQFSLPELSSNPPVAIENNQVKVGNITVPVEVAGLAAVLGLLGIIGTLIAVGQSSSGGHGNGSSGGHGNGSSGRALGENEHRADNGEVFEINPQARNLEAAQANLLFPGGEQGIGTDVTLTAAQVNDMGIREGDVFSIAPSALFPVGAMAKIESITVTGDTAVIGNRPANLEDIIVSTQGPVQFNGLLLDEGQDFVFNKSGDSKLSVKLGEDLSTIFKESGLLGDVKINLEGEFALATQLGFDRQPSADEGDKSFTIKQTHEVGLKGSAEQSIKLNSKVKKKLEEKFSKTGPTRRWAFPVGGVFVYLEATPRTTVKFDASVSNKFEAGATVKGSKDFGFKYDAKTGSFKQISSPTQTTAEPFFRMTPSGGSLPDAKLEVTPGINVEATMWKTFGGTIGGSVPIGWKHEKSRCTFYANVKAPEGEFFVQAPFFKDSKKSFLRFEVNTSVHEESCPGSDQADECPSQADECPSQADECPSQVDGCPSRVQEKNA